MRKYNESCCGNTGRNSQNFLNNRTWPYSAPMLVSRRTLAKDNWSCIARQCAVAGWLRRVHLPHRERSRHALHHPGRIESWRKKSQEGQAVSVFQSREPDVRQSRSRRKFNTIWTNPDLRCTKILGESTKIQYIGAIWSSLKEKDCSSIKTRSHAIAFFQHTSCDLYWESGVHEDWRGFILQSIPILQVSARRTRAEFATWTSGSTQSRSEKFADHQSEPSAKYGKPVAHFSRTHVASIPKKVSEVSTGKLVAVNVDYRIPGIPHSTVQKEDSNRKETVKRLIQQFENHPNRRLVSEMSKELITSMGNTEYFELCETSSEIQCLDCDLFWEAGIIHCTCGKCMQPTERNRQLNKERYDILSIPGYAIKKKSHSRCQTLAICAASHVPQST